VAKICRYEYIEAAIFNCF